MHFECTSCVICIHLITVKSQNAKCKEFTLLYYNFLFLFSIFNENTRLICNFFMRIHLVIDHQIIAYMRIFNIKTCISVAFIYYLKRNYHHRIAYAYAYALAVAIAVAVPVPMPVLRRFD